MALRRVGVVSGCSPFTIEVLCNLHLGTSNVTRECILSFLLLGRLRMERREMDKRGRFTFERHYFKVAIFCLAPSKMVDRCQ